MIDAPPAAPVEIVVEGDRIEVRRARAGAPGAAAATKAPPRSPGGWVVDLGETRPGEAPVRSLRLGWSG